jgi:hypothetical protein
LPLHYLDLHADDPRLINADYPDQGLRQGFTFNFEVTAEEAKRLRQVDRAEPLPGWSDAELEAASAARGNEPNPENGSPFDDPGKVAPELEISPDDVGLFGDFPMPAPDGRVMSLDAYMADIANDRELAATVKACRA